MQIIEIYGGFRIQFDAKLSITITEAEAKYLLEYLSSKKKNHTFDHIEQKLINPKTFSFYDCGEY
jgi:hypothetical protein